MREQDYILRHLAFLMQFITQAVRHRQAGQHEQALAVVLQAQAKLFCLPPLEIAELTMSEQTERLTRGETPEDGAAKCLAYSKLLREAGLCYRARNREDLAVGAFQMALHFGLESVSQVGVSDEAALAPIRELLSWVPADQLMPPVREMLSNLSLST